MLTHTNLDKTWFLHTIYEDLVLYACCMDSEIEPDKKRKINIFYDQIFGLAIS